MESKELILIDDEKVELIKRTVAKDATNDELALFLHQARRMGLDPLARQIHFQKYKGKDDKSNVSFITTIDGYRLIADRTGKYAGNKEPVFEGKINDSQYGASNGPDIPAKATVTIYKIVGGALREFSNSAYWKEYYPGEWKGHMWRKMPHVMLAKVAEAGALRKAFPADLSGAYTDEEMQQSDITTVEIIDAPHVDIKREKQRLAVVANADIEREESMTNDDLEPAPARKSDSVIADLRSTIEGSGDKVELGFINQRLVDSGAYKHTNHAFNAVKMWPDWPAANGWSVDKLNGGSELPTKKALAIFDWAIERKQDD